MTEGNFLAEDGQPRGADHHPLDDDLGRQLADLIQRKGYQNRSQVFRDIVRQLPDQLQDSPRR